MIELILQAERALQVGLLDQAERLYRQAVERDPQNAIAVVGLAQVAVERGDDRTGLGFARKALQIDPENAVARRLAGRLAEVIAYRGETLPGAAPGAAPGSRPAAEVEVEAAEAEAEAPAEPEAGAEAGADVAAEAPAGPEAGATARAPASAAPPGPMPAADARARRGLLDRILRRG